MSRKRVKAPGIRPTYTATIRTLKLYDILRSGDTRNDMELAKVFGCSYKSVQRYRKVIAMAFGGTPASVPKEATEPQRYGRFPIREASQPVIVATRPNACEHPEVACDGVCSCICKRCIDGLRN